MSKKMMGLAENSTLEIYILYLTLDSCFLRVSVIGDLL